MKEEGSNKEFNKEEGTTGNITKSLQGVLEENDVVIKGNVISQREKEYINKVVDEIYDMDWEKEDSRIELMFNLSLVIEELKKHQTK